jgi:DNA-binding transcriptional regulator YiaG
MTADQKSRVAELKAEIVATATGAGTPLKVRAATVALKQELRRGGVTARAVASALGVPESTLCQWERRTVTRRAPAVTAKARERSAGFRMVQVAAATSTSMSAPSSSLASPVRASIPSARGLRIVHAPSGLVVDGLDVEMLAALLKRMT